MATALHERLMEDLQSLVQALNLTASSGATGGVGTNVLIQFEEEAINIAQTPAVVISCEGEAEDAPDDLAVTELRGTTYPVNIKVVDQARPDYQNARTDYLAWRHAIFMRLQDMPSASQVPPLTGPSILPNCPECAFMRVRYMKIKPDKAAPLPVVAAVVAECYCTEPRPN